MDGDREGSPAPGGIQTHSLLITGHALYGCATYPAFNLYAAEILSKHVYVGAQKLASLFGICL